MNEQRQQKCWYEHRRELEPGMVFITQLDEKVRLESRVVGDGTDWHVSEWVNGGWWDEVGTIHPSDLVELVSQ